MCILASRLGPRCPNLARQLKEVVSGVAMLYQYRGYSGLSIPSQVFLRRWTYVSIRRGFEGRALKTDLEEAWRTEDVRMMCPVWIAMSCVKGTQEDVPQRHRVHSPAFGRSRGPLTARHGAARRRFGSPFVILVASHEGKLPCCTELRRRRISIFPRTRAFDS